MNAETTQADLEAVLADIVEVLEDERLADEYDGLDDLPTLFGEDDRKALRTLIAPMGSSEPCTAEPEMWFAPDGTPETAQAKQLCRFCSHRAACHEYALRYATDGVWGGYTETEREAIREEQGIPTPRLGMRDFVEKPDQTTTIAA